MQRFFESVLEPIFKAEGIKTIVEIGADKGFNTVKLIKYANNFNAKIYSIDPVPGFDSDTWEKENPDTFVMVKDLSLNAIKDIKDADCFLIDGDHNWYTVYHELKMIYDTYGESRFPLVFFHDILWPYDRRDLYYSPDNIPAVYRNDYEVKAMKPGCDELSDEGINERLCNAKKYGGEKNGVLTAVEDFVRDYPALGLKFMAHDVLFGLGMIASEERYPEAVKHFYSAEALKGTMKVCERERLDKMVEIKSLIKRLNKYSNAEKRNQIAKFYPDFGEGYSESTALMTGEYDAESGNYYGKVVFDRPPVSVRFDPVNESYCVLSDLSIITSTGRLEPAKTNGKCFDGTYVFTTTDPQIIFENKSNSREFKIKAQICPFKNISAAETIIELLESNNSLAESNKQLSSENLSLSGKVTSLSDEVASLSDEVTTLSDEVTALSDENKSLISAKNELLKTNSTLISERNNLQNEKNSNNKQLSSLNQQLSSLKESLKKTELSFNDAKKKNSALAEEVKKERKTAVDANAALQQNKQIAQQLYKGKKKIGWKHAAKSVFTHGLFATRTNIGAIKEISKNGGFDPVFYCSKNKDVLEKGIDPLMHFMWFGGYEGRNPSEDFDTKKYLARYADVKNSKVNPYAHYLVFGKGEKRKAFSTAKPVPVQNINSISSVTNSSKGLLCKTQSSLVSIIMPTWNRKNVIDQAINSVLNQTYKNYELIIVDDGSTDETKECINKKYSAQIAEGKIIYIYQNNAGVCAARNRGLEKSSGDYIAYLDSDNKWYPEYLDTMVNAFISNPQIQSAYCGLKCINQSTGQIKIRNSSFNRKTLINQNFIDLNVFMHRRSLYCQYGGFDTSLKRLVDWDLIIRYTRMTPAYHIKEILADYFEDNTTNRITTNVSLDDNRTKVLKKHSRERFAYGLQKINVAYILWDYPAGSQTFVFNEIKHLIDNGIDVKVFYKVTASNYKEPDFPLEAVMVNDSTDLAKKLIEYDISYMHAHFAYPTAYKLAYEASKLTNIPYSFAAHAVDIFLHLNDSRNHVDETANYNLCEKVLVPGGDFHLYFLRERGVEAHKIAVTNQAVDERFNLYCNNNKGIFKNFTNKTIKIVAIGRFIEKKGFEYLIKASKYLNENFSIDIYGYGDLEDEYKKLIAEYDRFNIVKLCGSIPNAMDCLSTADFLAAPCVVAENGDIDGMPTVILEAMAAGVMVIATDVSSIPYVVKDNYNGFIIPERNPEALADKLLYASSLSPSEKNLIIQNAYETVGNNTDSHTMASVVYNNIKQEYISIFLVTYCDKDFSETQRIIENIFNKTVTGFYLTIVDNNSPNKDFKAYLKNLENTNKNVNIISLSENIWCGPASNLALNTINTKYAIYICSNEGYPVCYGWEKNFIDYMEKNTNCAIAGAMSYSPSMVTREQYRNNSIFEKFRNKNYLDEISEPIKFVQGGIYILRMDAYKKCGGFSDAFPQSHMDVEYSYYLRSCGYSIGAIKGIYAGTVKTLPAPSDFVNDQTVAVHPFTFDKLKKVEEAIEEKHNICNICGHIGTFENNVCPKCNSTSDDRTLYEYLNENEICYRKDIGANITNYHTECTIFIEKLKKMFSVNGTGIAICNNDKFDLNAFDKIVFVCNDIDASANENNSFSNNVHQYYSRCTNFGRSKVIVYSKNK